MQPDFIYSAASYARASKDDAGSGTIENQLELIRGFVKSMPDIRIVSEKDDNGFRALIFFVRTSVK